MKKYALAGLIGLLFPFVASAQNWINDNDDEIIHFGFQFQYISSEFKIHKKASWREPFYDADTRMFVTDSLYSISSSSKPGFGLGFVSPNIRIGTNADIRLTPGLSFSDKVVSYEFGKRNADNTYTSTVVDRTVQSTMFDLPLGLKIKSDQRHNFRAYILMGVKYSMNIVSKKKTDDSGFAPTEKLLKIDKSYFSYEAAVGFDFYFEYFKMSPELKFSQSAKNILKPEVNPYSSPIDRLFLRNLQFSLFFE